MIKLRPGNVVIFHTPSKNSYLDVGMVLGVYKGVKMPKLHSGPTPINSVSAFRVVSLDLDDTEQAIPVQWTCQDQSVAWVVRVEGLVTILDVERSALVVVRPWNHEGSILKFIIFIHFLEIKSCVAMCG